MRNQIILKEKGDEKFKKSLNFKDPEKLLMAGTLTKSFLL
jgi:hypothetical protein